MSRSHLKKTVRWTIECSHFEIKMRVTVKILVSLFNTLVLRIWQIRRFVQFIYNQCTRDVGDSIQVTYRNSNKIAVEQLMLT